MALRTIILGESQPEDCPRCKGKEGYQLADYIKTHYTLIYDSEGNSKGGFYSDYQPIIHEAVTPYCRNCGHKLSFKVSRNTLH